MYEKAMKIVAMSVQKMVRVLMSGGGGGDNAGNGSGMLRW